MMKNRQLPFPPTMPQQFPLLWGFFVLLLSLVPTIIMGADGYVGIHDQMDGEVLVYILNAQHIGQEAFAPFMNGMSATSLTPPAYGSVLFYAIFPPFAAFLCNYLFVAVLAFLGMYLLTNSLLENRWLSVLTALIFCQLPFYSVYGLSVMGQPLLWYAAIRLWKGEKPWVSFGITALFAVFSSLVLVGFADLLLLLAFAAFMQLRRHPHARHAWLQTAILFVIYLLPNLSLLGQILLPADTVSHKSELVATANGLWDNFETMFLEGAYHAASLHETICGWAIVCVLVSFVFYKTWDDNEKKRVWGLFSLVVLGAAIAAFYALWHWAPIAALRNRLGGVFVSFQIDRFYWLYPTLWFMAFALTVWLLLRWRGHSRLQGILAVLCACVMTVQLGCTVYNNSVFKKNMQALTNTQDYVSWDDFYSPELFQEIEDYIHRPQESYRVGSVALFPSVPLYNGFYCIDGYSNNYDVAYKHRFRTIIRKELEKSPSLRSYFDNWGNRCYLFSAELGKNYYFTKHTTQTLTNLELSAEGLRLLGCDYIFSGLEIANPALSGLRFVKSFEHSDSPYRIWVYEVTENTNNKPSYG